MQERIMVKPSETDMAFIGLEVISLGAFLVVREKRHTYPTQASLLTATYFPAVRHRGRTTTAVLS